ncbi:unnamed protein product [Cyberlindnera jadinii]|uniref:DUF962-domain-containing protein n=1 Tax=Cyberlindnera jadinii (strain ATCC 18201 / CBS 1600 / BCRC 20928 / JCM 3617 / NBRC 0987 / NRRL Y-1542) TaxID=983966 RepID=A0A0H5CAE8_CYBJN|nr:hypothetical protein CYBJADRAFT_122780 [Cyberlindnera jadinii NRRL Y-1542]ODV75809.1 hypothetical protein CYBJADRAFT_122780 [Cyberlindnera jadinii NRRL Y-1542]CEP20519.1 unnamed protein product [Cyberlindnera jadinii]
MSNVFNLEKQLVFYRSYHYETLNVLVHSVFVPTILFTTIGILENVPLAPVNKQVYNLGNFGCLIYGAFYLLLDLSGGLIAAPIMFLIGYANTHLIQSVENYTYWLTVLFVVSWIAQFISHAVFEKRAPALLDNLVQALVLAPFFVLYEGLFQLGYRTDLKQRVDATALKNIQEFKKRS